MSVVIKKLNKSQKRRISLKPEVVDKLERCIGSYFGRSVASSIWCLRRSSCQFAVDPTLRSTLLEDHSMQFVDVFVNRCFLRPVSVGLAIRLLSNDGGLYFAMTG